MTCLFIGMGSCPRVWADSDNGETSPDVENSLWLWTPVSLQVPITDRVRLVTLSDRWFDDNIQGIDFQYLQNTLDVKVTDKVHVGAGHLWGVFYPEDQKNTEQRIIEYAQVFTPIGKNQISHRLVLEQRRFTWLDATSQRLRWREYISRPLGNTKFYGVLSNELMLNLTDTPGAGDNGIDQNRTLIALGRHITKHIDAEVGYMLRYFNRRAPGADRLNHIIHLSLNVKLDKWHYKPHPHHH